MKKVVTLFIFMLMLAQILLGCNNEVSSKRENDIVTRYDKLLFLPDTPREFVEYLYSNPIDFTMKNEEETSVIYSTKDINELYSKYYNIWYDEMNTVYVNLENQLTGEAKELLEKSQKAWEEENQRDSELWWYVFDLSKGHGSGDTSMIVIQSMDRVRVRTFLLAEYYYWLTGDFEFEFPQ